MSTNPYEPPQDVAQPDKRSIFERAITLMAAALIGCFCGVVIYVVLVLVVFFILIGLNILEYHWDFLNYWNLAAMFLGLLTMGLVGYFVNRRFSRRRPKPAAASPASALASPRE